MSGAAPAVTAKCRRHVSDWQQAHSRRIKVQPPSRTEIASSQEALLAMTAGGYRKGVIGALLSGVELGVSRVEAEAQWSDGEGRGVSVHEADQFLRPSQMTTRMKMTANPIPAPISSGLNPPEAVTATTPCTLVPPLVSTSSSW